MFTNKFLNFQSLRYEICGICINGNMHSKPTHNNKSEIRILRYSVMQSDGNSFCLDIVLDSFNKIYRDEDSAFKTKNVKSVKDGRDDISAKTIPI